MVANGSESREILLDPIMIAGSRGADGCEFDREVDREYSPRVDSLDTMGSVDAPARNSAAIADATGAAATFRFGEQNPFRKMVTTMTAVAKAEKTVARDLEFDLEFDFEIQPGAMTADEEVQEVLREHAQELMSEGVQLS